MAEALYHPRFGYYNRRDLQRWGRAGDYRTSPERSNLFAATLASYFLELSEELGTDLSLVEIGGGDGRFARGLLDAIERTAPAMLNSVRYIWIDTSQDARERAAEELQKYSSIVQIVDLDQLEPLSKAVVFSNELLDAFPVHRVTNSHGELKELYVTCNERSEFVWIADELSSEKVSQYCSEHVPALSENQIVEVNLGIAEWMKAIDSLLRRGFVITIDYGAAGDQLYNNPDRMQGTLRGFRAHEFVSDPLQIPGENDLTTTIDWTVVKSEGQKYGLEVIEFSQLDKFLIQHGVLEELELSLANAATEAEKSQITTLAREMILPSGMAASFQILVQKRD